MRTDRTFVYRRPLFFVIPVFGGQGGINRTMKNSLRRREKKILTAGVTMDGRIWYHNNVFSKSGCGFSLQFFHKEKGRDGI